MQSQISGHAAPTDHSFCLLLSKASAGDNQALEKILQLLEPDMVRLAYFIKMPKEDSIQEMKTVFIQMIREGKLSLM